MKFKYDSFLGAGANLRSGRFWVGTAVGVICLALILYSTSLAGVSEALARTRPLLLALALLAFAIVTVAKAVRWKVLLSSADGRMRLGQLLSILLIGQMINAVFPLRLGEVARVYLAHETGGLPPGSTASSIVVEKVMDSVLLALCLAVLLPLIPLPAWMHQPALMGSAGAVLLVGLLGLLAYQGHKATPILRRLVSFLPGADLLQRHLQLGLEGVKAIGWGRIGLMGWALSGFIWFMAALVNWLAFLAFGVELPFVAALFLLVVLHIGIAVPSSPGRVGVFHLLTVLALSVFGVESALALSYGIVLHLIVYLPVLVLGAVLLWWQNLALSRAKATVVSKSRPPAESWPWSR